MKRFLGLWRDMWYLWVVLLGGGIVAGLFKSVFFLTIPITLFTFFYFGFMRYDENGKQRSFDD